MGTTRPRVRTTQNSAAHGPQALAAQDRLPTRNARLGRQMLGEAEQRMALLHGRLMHEPQPRAASQGSVCHITNRPCHRRTHILSGGERRLERPTDSGDGGATRSHVDTPPAVQHAAATTTSPGGHGAAPRGLPQQHPTRGTPNR